MSNRGSFVTEYIGCSKCFQVVKKSLWNNDYFNPIVQIGKLPILAGKACGMYVGEEAIQMEQAIEGIERQLCHNITIVVIPDCGEPEIFNIEPLLDARTFVEKKIQFDIKEVFDKDKKGQPLIFRTLVRSYLNGKDIGEYLIGHSLPEEVIKKAKDRIKEQHIKHILEMELSNA